MLSAGLGCRLQSAGTRGCPLQSSFARSGPCSASRSSPCTIKAGSTGRHAAGFWQRVPPVVLAMACCLTVWLALQSVIILASAQVFALAACAASFYWHAGLEVTNLATLIGGTIPPIIYLPCTTATMASCHQPVMTSTVLCCHRQHRARLGGPVRFLHACILRHLFSF
jgi:hypothetical protein